MTKAQARSLANECVNTLIDAGVLEEQRDLFALDVMTESICTAYAHQFYSKIGDQRANMNVPTTIHTKDFGDIPIDANAEWGLLPDLQDVGFPAGDHLYCFVFLKKENPYTLGYYITTAYGSQRELESGEL